MKTIETTVYTIDELKDLFPDGYRKAYERFRQSAWEFGAPWADETMKSLVAVIDACGFTLREYSLGGSDNRSQNIRVTSEGYATNNMPLEDLDGPRALAYMWKYVLKPLGYTRPTFGPVTKETWNGREYPKGGKWYVQFPGLCPFTGYCADEDFLESTWKALQSGSTLKEALEQLADEYARMTDDDMEQAESEESFLANIGDGEFFTEDGDEA